MLVYSSKTFVAKKISEIKNPNTNLLMIFGKIAKI